MTEQEKIEAYGDLFAKFTNLEQIEKYSKQLGLDWRE